MYRFRVIASYFSKLADYNLPGTPPASSAFDVYDPSFAFCCRPRSINKWNVILLKNNEVIDF